MRLRVAIYSRSASSGPESQWRLQLSWIAGAPRTHCSPAALKLAVHFRVAQQGVEQIASIENG